MRLTLPLFGSSVSFRKEHNKKVGKTKACRLFLLHITVFLFRKEQSTRYRVLCFLFIDLLESIADFISVMNPAVHAALDIGTGKSCSVSCRGIYI